MSVRNTTLVFLVKKSEAGSITDVCLAMKKRGFGKGRWNGVGGKQQEGESVQDAARRETKEEIGVEVEMLDMVAELEFRFAHNPDWDQMVYAYFVESWKGEPVESEEMRPQWFTVGNIPFETMWPDDIFWLPKVIARYSDSIVKGRFVFGENDVILEKEVTLADR